MFRVEYLKLTNHPQLGTIELFLSDIKEINNILKPYTSVVIGPNGTGKSFLLRAISDILTQFNLFQTTGVRKINLPFGFHIRYKVQDDIFEILSHLNILTKNKEKKTFLYFKNRSFIVQNVTLENSSEFRSSVVKFSDVVFPSLIIVNSVMLNDRFLFRDSKSEDFYQYLGVRSTSSTASTKSAIKGVINKLFSESISNQDFLVNLKELLFFLGFENKFEVEYNTKINKLFFSGYLTVKDFKQYYEFWWDEKFKYSKRDKNNPIWSKPFYDKYYKKDDDKIVEIVDYLNEIANSGSLKDKYNSTSKFLRLNFFDNQIDESDIWKIIDLEKLDIINVNGIRLAKNNSNMNISDISSGEYHLLISLIGIFSKIKENALILIDEPEISLHPNWQMQYISFLKKVFIKSASCHFIITSHSHFIVSDLEGQSSSVTALTRDKETNKLQSKLLKTNTFGWAAEEILLKVFKVNTSRNYYIADRLGEFLDYIADSNTTEAAIKQKFYELEIDKLHDLSDEDPLKVVYNTIIKEYVLN